MVKPLGERMQMVLDRLGIPLIVVWKPDPNLSIHGEIKGNVVFVYDEDEEEALATLTHEIIEFKLKHVTGVYRTMINSLIDGYEKLAYREKEGLIEFLPRIFLETQKNKY